MPGPGSQGQKKPGSKPRMIGGDHPEVQHDAAYGKQL